MAKTNHAPKKTASAKKKPAVKPTAKKVVVKATTKKPAKKVITPKVEKKAETPKIEVKVETPKVEKKAETPKVEVKAKAPKVDKKAEKEAVYRKPYKEIVTIACRQQMKKGDLFQMIKDTYPNDEVTMETLNPSQVAFTVDGTRIPEEGYLSVKNSFI
jgi:uncharacterized membrane protein YqiK